MVRMQWRLTPKRWIWRIHSDTQWHTWPGNAQKDGHARTHTHYRHADWLLMNPPNHTWTLASHTHICCPTPEKIKTTWQHSSTDIRAWQIHTDMHANLILIIIAMVAGTRMIHGKLSENYRTGKRKKKNPTRTGLRNVQQIKKARHYRRRKHAMMAIEFARSTMNK